MRPEDSLTPTYRNIIFLFTTTIIWGCLLYSWLELGDPVREESLYLSFFIVSTILFVGLFLLVIIDSFRNRDNKIKSDLEKERKNEIDKYNKSGLYNTTELAYDNDENLFAHLKYFGNSFETSGDLWRTILIAIIAITIFVSFWIIYSKHDNGKKDNASYIILASVVSLAMAGHVLILIFQLVHLNKVNKVKNNSLKNLAKTKYLSN